MFHVKHHQAGCLWFPRSTWNNSLFRLSMNSRLIFHVGHCGDFKFRLTCP